jgi:hypothetical protein
MNVIRKYIDRFKEDKVVIKGIGSLYLLTRGILPSTETIDIEVVTDSDPSIIIDRWLSYLHEYDEVPPIQKDTLLVSKTTTLKYHIHVVKNAYTDTITISNILVESPSSLFTYFSSIRRELVSVQTYTGKDMTEDINSVSNYIGDIHRLVSQN